MPHVPKSVKERGRSGTLFFQTAPSQSCRFLDHAMGLGDNKGKND